MAKKELTYGMAISELEAIVAEIEAENIDVDILAEKVKRAAHLITFCRTKLKGTEEEVNMVLSGLEESEKEK